MVKAGPREKVHDYLIQHGLPSDPRRPRHPPPRQTKVSSEDLEKEDGKREGLDEQWKHTYGSIRNIVDNLTVAYVVVGRDRLQLTNLEGPFIALSGNLPHI